MDEMSYLQSVNSPVVEWVERKDLSYLGTVVRFFMPLYLRTY